MAWTSYTWGSTVMLVEKNTYNPPAAENGITEIQILGDPVVTTPASVIQQSGRGRKKASFSGYATNAVYLALLADSYAATVRTFTDPDGNTMSATIENISAARENGPYPYHYSVSLMEV